MTHTQRMKAMLAGRPIDRPPVAAWSHAMNLEDRHARDFAKSLIDFQNAFQFDFIKVMSNSFYMVEDMGNVMRPSRDWQEFAFLCCEKLAIQQPSDWDHLRAPDPKKGALAREIEAIRRVLDHFGDDVPVTATIFCPVTWAAYLSMDIREYIRLTNSEEEDLTPVFLSYYRENEKRMRRALDIIHEANVTYMDALAQIGVSGFFYSQPFAHSTWPSKDVYEELCGRHDRAAFDSVRDKTWFNMLHVCGRSRLAFDWVLDYNVDAFNWDDCFALNPSLGEIRQKTDKVLVGGLNRLEDLEGPDREKIYETIKRRAYAAMEQAGDKLVFSGGCAWGENALHRFCVWQEVMDEIASQRR